MVSRQTVSLARVAGKRLALALAIAGAAATSAQAADSRERHFNTYEFTPFYGFATGGGFEDPADGSDRDIDSSNSFGLMFNIAADDWRHYDFLYSKQGTEIEAGIDDGAPALDLDIEYLQVGGSVDYIESEHVIPYFGITVGAARFSPDLDGFDDETKVAFSIGAGMRIPITEHFSVRLDARSFITLLDSESDFFCVSAPPVGTCRIRVKSDTMTQFVASLGVTIGF